MYKFLLVSAMLALSIPAHAVCTRGYFDNTLYHIDVTPREEVAGSETVGKLEFITGFNRFGIMPPTKLLWAYDFLGYDTSVYMGSANRDLTRLSSRRFKRSCLVSIKMSGKTPGNNYAWSFYANGFASLASVDAEAPDIMVLPDARVTYAGYTEWADVVVTRLK